ncbi:AAA family ATPase [Aliarcobacter butzleri]|uniref:AAA family ATPase n=1 Tax=Aliarcobacter butzleri TaxID=28197 RepID=UPI0012F9BA09|nr:AAA family ATPase [Aliarcobacter butzleri]
MELVYLWVENYKNIRNQGFNFSPRFECEYNQDTKELTINENENYVNIFPNNINITAIVGENGSGKSSILNIILEIIEEKIEKKYILVFNNNSLQYISNFEFKTDLTENKNFLTYRNIFAYINKPHKPSPFRNYNVVEIDKKAIANILAVEYGKFKNEFQISSFMYLPNQIEIKLRTSDDLINENITFFKPLKREKIKKIFEALEDEYHKFLFICYGRKKGLDVDIDILNDRDSIEREMTDILNISDFHKYFLSLTNEKIFNISDLTEKQKDIYIRENGYFHFFDFDMIYKTDKEEIRFNNLSHGEQMIFGQLLNIYFFSNSSSNEKLIFLFDEPEIALHPKWQKNYINEIYNLFDKLGKNYHFIFTSHSPFLLSDLPKKNVIFLEKYHKEDEEVKNKNQKEANCKNVTKETNIETFGANIHTLLSNGFFMSDGLMGEFAKEKINQVYNFIVQRDTNFIKTKEEAQNIINLIGEPLIKKQLQKLFDETFNKSNLTLDDEIELLEKKLNALKELKNDKN